MPGGWLHTSHPSPPLSTGAGLKPKPSIVAAGRDGALRELNQGNVVFEVGRGDGAADAHVTQLLLSTTDKRLVAGTRTGALSVYSWPLELDKHVADVHVHVTAPPPRTGKAHGP